jgi:hypothetical protein
VTLVELELEEEQGEIGEGMGYYELLSSVEGWSSLAYTHHLMSLK